MMFVLQLTKKNIQALILVLLSFSGTLLSFNPFLNKDVHKPELVVLVTSYNNENYFYRNLDSIVHQKLDIPFHIIYVNDCSTDRTGQLVESYVRTHHLESMFTIIHNKENVGALANQYNVINTLPDHVIVAQMDGDDFLAHDHALKRVLQEYTNENTWMTYGQVMYYPEGPSRGWVCEPLPQDVLDNNSFRSHSWVTSQLKTFYAGLFKRIKKEDLLYQGYFFKITGDFAFMFPMLEMASRGHIVFIPDVLYIYNHHNPISDHNKDWNLQTRVGQYIRSKPKYDPIIETTKCATQSLEDMQEPKDTIFLAILARNKAHMLRYYLPSIDKLEYDKQLITVYINTNNNADNTEEVLREWAEKNKNEYKQIVFESHEVENLENTPAHEWTLQKLKILGAIRNKSLQIAKDLKSDYYFVVDCDNFIIPSTLKYLLLKRKPIIAPMLTDFPKENPNANFFGAVNAWGYWENNPLYWNILYHKIVGTIEVPLVHCTYLIDLKYADQLTYVDDSDHYEFIIFSRSARNSGVSQYICNELNFGTSYHVPENQHLTLTLEKEKEIIDAYFATLNN